VASTAQTALGIEKSSPKLLPRVTLGFNSISDPSDSESSTKLVPRVTHGFDSPNSPQGLDIINETSAMGGAWIRQRKQPKGLTHHQRKCCHGYPIVSTAHRDSEITNETSLRVTHGFDSANNPRDSDIINESAATGAALLRQPKQPLVTQKSSTKLVARVTHAFNSANRPRN